MQDSQSQRPEISPSKETRSATLRGNVPCRNVVGKSILGTVALLFLDVVINGASNMSIVVCPLWFLFSLTKNIIRRTDWKITLVRIAIPLLVLWLVMFNESFQRRIAEKNAPQIIAACEQFHDANGRYPKALEDLVPKYLSSIPPAKYCVDGRFYYWNTDEHPTLVWYTAPYCRKIYDFVDRRWTYLE